MERRLVSAVNVESRLEAIVIIVGLCHSIVFLNIYDELYLRLISYQHATRYFVPVAYGSLQEVEGYIILRMRTPCAIKKVSVTGLNNIMAVKYSKHYIG
jgi:hypothetical protein